MHGSATRYLFRWSVASALAGVAAFTIVTLAPTGGTVARADLTGTARVIDGDTIEIAGRRVRLEGIDAPESAQTCARRFVGSWACGKAATKALDQLIANREVSCESHGSDAYERMLGVCFVSGHEINAQMVRRGHAWAFVKYSKSYIEQEAEARALRIGIWQGESEPAWDFRKKRWAGAEQIAPRGCAIKGNVTNNGHIYHMPWSPWYGKVRINEAKGERWFCSEADALAAGWRPVDVN